MDNCKKGLRYNAVTPPHIGLFMPPKPDLSYIGLEEFTSEPTVETLNAKTSEDVPKVVKKDNGAPILEDWKSDDEDASVPQPKIEKKTVKPSVAKGNPQIDLQEKGVIISRCPGHMTGNMSYLTDYEEIDEGYVAFGGNLKGGKITGKGTIKTGELDFKNIYFVKVLKFNLFSVLQMYDKKNSVLFNDTECVVLSLDFKLTDENHFLLRVPRKNNMYSVDLKNIIPKGKSCKRFTFQIFENEQTCVACQKGKQHKASCKTKTENSMSLPLHMLHMDLFGLTFVKSLKKKMYCLVVTDDSRFTWVLFLSTKDETSGILKSFITRIENLVDHKVKVIRHDNGTEFKNRDMNQFCEMKGIMRQYSVARTPYQNGFAERRNRTLIEAARTMLANLKLPTTFWAEVVSTACYVQNRFDGKADERFFIRYSLNSKAFRLLNSRTRIVKETLHIRFSENTPNSMGSGLNWLFDIDALTKTMNYQPVVAGTQSNGNAEPKSSQDARFKPSNDVRKKVNEVTRQENECKDQEEKDSVNNTNRVNAVSSTVNVASNEVNVVGRKSSIELLNDPNILSWRILAYLKTQMKMFLGHTQEDGIDYDEVFAPLARIEAIRLFLAYASFKDFVVYQVDVKSDFLYGKIQEEELCTSFEKLMHEMFQMSSMGELAFFLGLQVKQKLDGIFISQDKYVAEILKKFGFSKVKTASTPMKTQKPLLKDEDGEEVDVHIYRSMIGSLMYLTSLKPDIMFTVCACSRYQVNPKVSHLHAVKRNFRYLKGQPKSGLWYPKDSLLDLMAYTDTDYARASLDKKFTTGGYQFLGCKLISWQCKKQIVVENSITKAEYVAAFSCCGQVL
nr:putative ribonuclease H-like domain-containing protein [Tanacetum cinerariifolium]